LKILLDGGASVVYASEVISPVNKPKPAPPGFSLVELLVVMAIIAMLTALSAPAISSLTRGNRMNENLLALGGIFEQARQLAISRNTFVWVAFSDPLPGTPSDGVLVATIAAKGGIDSLNWSTAAVSVAGSSDFEIAGKIRTLKGIRIMDKGALSVTNLPSETSLGSLQSVQLQASVAGQTKNFTKAIQFTPTGEARVQTFSRFVELGMAPVLPGAAAANVAVWRLAGITGRATLYRPN